MRLSDLGNPYAFVYAFLLLGIIVSYHVVVTKIGSYWMAALVYILFATAINFL